MNFFDLNKLKKLDEIGNGAFGEVYKVVEKDTTNIFAAKVSFNEINNDDVELITNLKREVGILSQLIHPAVLRFIGYSPLDFDQTPCPVIITEYSSNGSLNDLIKLDRILSAPKAWTDTKKLINIYGIASAMSYLHSHNIIHRDLKPANILEDENLFPKIADFGLSKIYHQNIDSMTSQSTIGFKGTPIYIAPEIWQDKKYTKAGDVYAFAMIVYELLTHNEPFKDYNFFTLFSKVIINGERPKFQYPLPRCYRDLIEKCWSSNPEKRPTFNSIINRLRRNKEFITETIDEIEYFNYIDFIDHEENSFDTNKKIKTILPTRTNNEDIITIGEFNIISLNSQKQVISNIIENKSTLNKFKGFLEFLEYFERFNPEPKIQYFYIPTKNTGTTVEYFFQQKSTIALSYQLIELINEHKLFESPEFHNLLKSFNKLLIDLKYPTNSFDSIYTQVLNLKEKNNDHLRINIIINSLNKTDMKFRNDENIYSVVIGNDVTELSGTFFGCSSLNKIKISSSLTSIGGSTFEDCTLLSKISIPSSVKEIGDDAFQNCKSLSQITFENPCSIIKIGEHAFSQCLSLIQIAIPPSVTIIGADIFGFCGSLTHISFIDSSPLSSIPDQCFTYCNSLTRITIPPSITTIGDFAFSNCTLLRQISIPTSVNKIGLRSFNECLSLAQISFQTPSSLKLIGEKAFMCCLSLKHILIPSSVTEIDKESFLECKSLEQISFETPSSLTSLGEGVFKDCVSLKHISIPSSMTDIPEDIFDGCHLLNQIMLNQFLESNDSLSEINFEEKSIIYSQISNSQGQIIDDFISSQDAYQLIRYLHGKFNNDIISNVYEKCRQKSTKFYIKIIQEGLSINDAVSHHKYAMLCIKESIIELSPINKASKLKEAVSHLKESIKNGYIFSYLLLSFVYHDFYKKYFSSFNSLKSGSILGEKYCKCMIGYFIAHGIGTEKNFMKGVSIILNNKVANFYEQFATDIGIYYAKLTEIKIGKSCISSELNSKEHNDENEKQAFKWFEFAFNKKMTLATINNLGVCYLRGFGVEKSIKKAKEIFEIGIQQNDSNSKYHMGFIYEEEENPKKSFEFYKESAYQNHIHAQSKCAYIQFQNGCKEESVKFYKKASNQGDTNSQSSLEKLLNVQNNDYSVSMLKYSANKGNIESQEILLAKSISEQDSENLYKYFNLLLQNGKTKVPLEYALKLYKMNRFKESYHYFSLLRNINHPIAIYFIGIMKFYGQGCEKNKEESFSIMNDLSKKGIDKATNFIEDHFDLNLSL